MPQVPQVSSVASIDIRPPVSNAPRSDDKDAFSQLLHAGDNEPAPAEPHSRDNGPSETRASERPDRPNRRDDSDRAERDSDTPTADNSDQAPAKDAAKESSKDKDGSSSGSDDKPKDHANKDSDLSTVDVAPAQAAPVEAATNANIQAVTAAVVASADPQNTDAGAQPDANQKIEAAAAPQALDAPKPQTPQAPDTAEGKIDAAAQAALNGGKPATNAKKDSTQQIPQAATDDTKPQAEQVAQPAKQAAVDVSTLSAPKLFQNAQPQDGKQPLMQDQNAAPANAVAAAAPEAKPNAGNAAPEHETLESVLSKHFSNDIHVSNNAQIVLPDPARSLQNNSAPMSVSLQTSASAANNQPVPLQAASLAIEIASRAKDGSRQFEIRLDPPELGRIDVKLDVDKSGQVNTHLTVDRPETLDLLRRDSQGLERALQQAGLKTSDGSLEFSLRQQTPDGAFNQRNQAQANPQGAASAGVEVEQTAVVHAEQYQWAARLRGGVDIRV